MKMLVVAAGAKPPAPLLRKRADEADFVIAVDGGLYALTDIGIVPGLIVGDMDSVEPSLIDKMRAKGSDVVLAQCEKNDTDTWLAMQEARKREANEVVLLGATGGRTDHLLSNLMLLKWSLKNGVKLTIEDEVQTIEIGAGDFEIYGKTGQTVSILPVNSFARVTVKGLYYPLQNLLLTNGRPRGVSNVFQEPKATIHTTQPVLVITVKGNPQPI